MKLLLTGATGFVGRNLLLQALKENRYSKIYVPVRSIEKLKNQLSKDGYSEMPSSIEPIVGEAPNWNFQNLGQVDHVIHSAGVIFARTRKDYFDCNVEGTLELFRSLPRPARAVILSSQSAAGPCPQSQDCRREEDEDHPLTWYGKSKLEMEKRLRSEFPDLNYLCLRPPMIFGARDQATLPLFKMVNKPVFFKPGFKSKYYSFISVNDLVGAVFAALNSKEEWEEVRSRHFFVAANEPVSDRTLINTAAKVSKKRGMLLTIPQPLLWGVSRVIDSIPTWRATIPTLSVDRAKEIWPNRWVVSSRAFQERFGWQPREEFRNTLEETRNWYVSSGQL